MSAPKFHPFTIKFNHTADRIITEVTLSEAFDPRNPKAIIPKSIRAQALWDTGATKSVITLTAAAKLGLKPVGTGLMNAAGGERTCNTYLVNFFLPNNVGIAGVHVMDCEDGHPFEAIIGMDIITGGDFAITNVGGKTTVTFRYPSIQTIDYSEGLREIKEAEKQKAPEYPKQGRNDLCACGSGKKYKKCHGSPNSPSSPE